MSKRPALSEISTGISNVLIDSSLRRKQPRRAASGKALKAISENAVSNVVETRSRFKQSAVAPPVPTKFEDPCPSYDYDAQQKGDLTAYAEFANEIFKYFRFREKLFTVGDYIRRQSQLTAEHRAVLNDWMVEVQETFELNHETLYLAVKLVDMYLDRKPAVDRKSLQLIAASAMFISSKFDERQPPMIDDFIYITDQTFAREELIGMEIEMLDIVGYDVGMPLSYSYLRRYARASMTDMATLTLSRYILETSLLFYEVVGQRESLLAAGAFMLALGMKNPSQMGQWSPILHKYTGYPVEQVVSMAWKLNHMMHIARQPRMAKLTTVYTKYSHEVFHQTALIELLPDQYAENTPLSSLLPFY